MRPARKGPENRLAPATSTADYRGFNEAGPQGAGKPHYELATMHAGTTLQ